MMAAKGLPARTLPNVASTGPGERVPHRVVQPPTKSPSRRRPSDSRRSRPVGGSIGSPPRRLEFGQGPDAWPPLSTELSPALASGLRLEMTAMSASKFPVEKNGLKAVLPEVARGITPIPQIRLLPHARRRQVCSSMLAVAFQAIRPFRSRYRIASPASSNSWRTWAMRALLLVLGASIFLCSHATSTQNFKVFDIRNFMFHACRRVVPLN